MKARSRHFNPRCKRCPRLARHLKNTKQQFPDYHCAPVPAIGEPGSRCLIVGLAPGLHGANQSGKPFVGDQSGDLLWETLHQLGWSNQPLANDPTVSIELTDTVLTNAVKCLPPENRPTGEEIKNCQPYLKREIEASHDNAVIIALGKIAHDAVIKAHGLTLKHYPFGHAAEHDLNGRKLIDTYHCSRYNLQTRRLTPTMFKAVFYRAQTLMSAVDAP